MQIFNIGPLELMLIIILALVILGPEDMVKYSKTAGKWVNKVIHSDTWKSVVNTSREISEIPKKVIQEAGIEEELKEINDLTKRVDQSIKEAINPQRSNYKSPFTVDPKDEPLNYENGDHKILPPDMHGMFEVESKKTTAKLIFEEKNKAEDSIENESNMSRDPILKSDGQSEDETM